MAIKSTLFNDLFVVTCRDRPSSSPARAAALSAHLEYLENVIERVQLAAALKDEGDAYSGSLFVVRATDAADARRLVEQDPFFLAGVWDELHVSRLGAAVGAWPDLQPIA